MLRPCLFALPPEWAHGLALTGLRAAARVPGVLSQPGAAHPALAMELWELKFANPVGLAAGMDKDGVAAHAWPRLGFGFVELGTVTPHAQSGNPRPRLFRLPADRALINRMGFNNQGVERLALRLRGMARTSPIGINLGKNRDTPLEQAAQDYLLGLAVAYPLADYIAVNVSSPNTPGLRDLQQGPALRALLQALGNERARLRAQHGRWVPLLLKVAPDLAQEDLAQIAQTALDCGVDGLIACNTTLERDHLVSAAQDQAGGLSGMPLRPLALRAVARLYRLTGGRLPLVGVGGIFGAEDAYAFIRAGASLVQVYTGLVYQGPGLVQRINAGLVNLLERDGLGHLSQAVGADAPTIDTLPQPAP
ncbi:MAG TPA: quinone-dependent dihydroorotate dehydrogenase [bacterium]|nr:quinone-dependent dihydroorotate dehydrogenase [bacterium]